MGDQRVGGMSCQSLKKAKPFLAMVSLQFGYAGMYIISMVSLKRGMSHYILATYRHVVATIVIAPFAIVLERKIRPKMTWPIFLRIVLLGFLEPVLDQNLYFLGMKYTSATFASATVNMLPAITFVMAIIFRLETVNFKKLHSTAKVVGTVVTVMGAMVMTLYKGPIVDFIGGREQSHHKASTESADQHWVTGTLMLLGSICGWASFFILQSFTLKMYPVELSLTAWICLMGMVEGSIVSLIMERDLSVWAIGWDSRLLASVYTGIVCSGIAYYLQGFVSKERGPVFVTSFSPLCMIITAVLGFIVLAEQVHLGSVIGAIIIVFGLYTVVWGKSKDAPNSKGIVANEKGTRELPITDTIRSSSIITTTTTTAADSNNDAANSKVSKIPHA
ncbi:WAT1-related protein At4g08300-like [Juglans microcarpa x Juglans regia]|uniref:WAT1-related protein At4g08300-like n=1 Tax=Juglans microcarpa x Juglans regia TaxID=2249226 RepID=UPI001B7F6F91|nr:WAT1-related protein At4g08300-like [Juglans microcarpa x Juglans regia]XP_041011068.1 WAT1-related protein At4g08300-like [Juglans microcarpa x Juglans regia]